MEQYIPYSLICDLFSRNLETYLYKLQLKIMDTPIIVKSLLAVYQIDPNVYIQV